MGGVVGGECRRLQRPTLVGGDGEAVGDSVVLANGIVFAALFNQLCEFGLAVDNCIVESGGAEIGIG